MVDVIIIVVMVLGLFLVYLGYDYFSIMCFGNTEFIQMLSNTNRAGKIVRNIYREIKLKMEITQL